ncbi:hypothetical protein [Lacinutrix chionoecetis]
MKINIPYISLFVLIVMSCSNVSEEDLLEPVVLEPGETVNYTEDIAPIMENNCNFCHSNPPVNGASSSLTSYSEVKLSVENLNLIDRISRQAGENGAMPLGGPRLPQNLIDLVSQWEADGFIEN